MIPMFLPACMSLSLLRPAASRGLGQRPPQQGWCLQLRHRHRWPGFGDEASQGQWGLIEPRHQDQGPPPAKDTHPPQAGGMPRPRGLGDAGRDVQDRAGRDRRVRLPPNAQQPQGRHGNSQPPAGRPVGLRQAGALPLPAGHGAGMTRDGTRRRHGQARSGGVREAGRHLTRTDRGALPARRL
jgi:hypothetical protein